MFTFKKEALKHYDLKKAKEFVDFWSRYYKETTKKPNTDEVIHYFDELNIGNDLTKENIKLLLRWKDPHYLTEIRLSGKDKGKKNPQVEKVVNKLEEINNFRSARMDTNGFKKIAEGIFKNGTIWMVFLFNVARPWEFPMADANVFRAYRVQVRESDSKEVNWDLYMGYREYFFEVAINAGKIERKPTGKENNIHQIVEKLKKVDNAILMFGKFLKQYGGVD
jgi:hypothetical protein